MLVNNTRHLLHGDCSKGDDSSLVRLLGARATGRREKVRVEDHQLTGLSTVTQFSIHSVHVSRFRLPIDGFSLSLKDMVQHFFLKSEHVLSKIDFQHHWRFDVKTHSV